MEFSKYDFLAFRKDFLASIVVFLVAIPLCLGIALACGVSATAGLISGIIGGLVAGIFAGCPLQVSGPAAGLIAITVDIISQHGLENLGIIVFGAGIVQLLLGVLKLGQWFRAVSPAVIHGMLAGIGAIIFASQFHAMVDNEAGAHSTIENIVKIPESILMAAGGESSHQMAAGIGFTTIFVIIIWEMLPEKYKFLPSALVGVLSAIFIAGLFNMPIHYVSIPEKIIDDINFMNFNNLDYLLQSSAMISVLSLAFIASAEALLTATAIDNIHTGARTKYNQEIGAQGLGNIVAGFFGALPLTGVIVRGTANIHAGGKTRGVALFHGFWILLFFIFLPFYLEKIPTSCLAAILVYTGYKLMNPMTFKKLLKFGAAEGAIFLTTVIAIISIDLLIGIMIGFGVSLARLLYETLHLDIEITEEDADHINVELEGTANFINLPRFASQIESIEEGKKISIFFDKLHFIDHASIDFLINWEKQYIAKGGSVSLEFHTLTDRFSSYKENLKEDENSKEAS